MYLKHQIYTSSIHGYTKKEISYITLESFLNLQEIRVSMQVKQIPERRLPMKHERNNFVGCHDIQSHFGLANFSEFILFHFDGRISWKLYVLKKEFVHFCFLQVENRTHNKISYISRKDNTRTILFHRRKEILISYMFSGALTAEI